MKVEIEVNTDDLHTKTVDKQGRLYLGREYAEQELEVAVVETDV